jgi:hypothetical protein
VGVQGAHPADVAGEVAVGDEVGERGLLERGRVEAGVPGRGDEAVDEPVGDDEVPDT